MRRLSCAALLLAVLSLPAAADPIADFYRGKTVTLLVGTLPGSEYDTHARLVARHLGAKIPGSPVVVAQYMAGAGGLNMANHLYAIAARDGTVIGAPPNQLAALQASGGNGVTYDAARFAWIGAIAPTHETISVMARRNIASLDDVRHEEVLAGAVGKGSMTYFLPAMLNELLGTKFKIVAGYGGGSEILLAMERGEVDARENTWSSWKLTRPEWLREKTVVLLGQAGPRLPELGAVPSIEDMAKDDADRQVIALVVSGTQLGRPVVAPPGVPPERVEALRAAFDAMAADPDFLADAAAQHVEVEPVRGHDMQAIVETLMRTPKELAAHARKFLE